MKFRDFLLAAALSFIATGGAQSQQTSPPAAETSVPTIKVETGLVLVDTVVTDKKGNYIRDLTAKDFRVFEDNKEQPIKNFSSESNASAPSVNQRRYLVLFFDNSTMSPGDQATARAAALKFLDANTGANRYIAVVDFGGTLRIAQNFTTDAERLKQIVSTMKFSAVSPAPPVVDAATPSPSPIPQPSSGVPQLASTSANFGARTLLLALRDMAKELAVVPVRKTLVLLSAGFPLNSSDWVLQSELMAAIDACNKANVAIYPIDVRGVGAVSAAPPMRIFPASPSARLVTATLRLDGEDRDDQDAMMQSSDQDPPAHLVYVQHSGTGGGHGSGGTSGRGGVSTGSGSRTGSTTPTIVAPNAPYSNGQGIVPTVDSGGPRQAVLYELAQGTGGFVIGNTNDLLGGLQKIAQEQDQYYLLSYTPPSSEEGTCHTLRVKVDRGDTIVRSRSGYCNVKPTDLLAGKPIEKQLENQAGGSQPGNVAASMQAPYFYTAANVARIDLAINIPAGAIKFEKQKGKQHAEVNVLALAYKPDGSEVARFSDSVAFDFDNKEQVEQFAKQPYHYENQFEIAPGRYDLKVAFNSGQTSFGKLQMPLVVDNYDGKQLSMSTVAMSTEVHPLNEMAASLDAALLENRKPLVAQGMQIVPTGSDRFQKTDPAVFYIEIYDPLLTSANPPKVGLQVRVLDRKTGAQAFEIHGLLPNDVGNPVVSLGMKLPLDKLTPGSYRLELTAMDTAGHSTSARTADFEVE
jgi:VWFA-related protein